MHSKTAVLLVAAAMLPLAFAAAERGGGARRRLDNLFGNGSLPEDQEGEAGDRKGKRKGLTFGRESALLILVSFAFQCFQFSKSSLSR